MTLARDSDEVLKKRANASFKKEERAKDAKVGAAAYEAAGRAVAVNTERLRALRLAKEAADRVEEAARPVKPPTQKRMARPTSKRTLITSTAD
jgi:hypothetical protein